MHSLLTAAFPHRHNADGSHVAICRRCFAMLASVKNEDELELYEVRHKCDRLTLYQSLFPAPKQGLLSTAPHLTFTTRLKQSHAVDAISRTH